MMLATTVNVPTISTTPIISAGSRSRAARTDELPEARPVEDRLGDDGAGDQLGQQDREDRDDRDQGVAQRVADEDDPARRGPSPARS